MLRRVNMTPVYLKSTGIIIIKNTNASIETEIHKLLQHISLSSDSDRLRLRHILFDP